MREIKFRAWNQKEMILTTSPGYLINFCGDLYTVDNVNGVTYYKRDDWVLMQYTGLKDKNGKEIYESDRLRVDEYYTHPDGRVIKSGEYEVRYMLGSFGIFRHEGWWDLSDFTVEIIPNEGVIPNVKVIGNIYENPELIVSDKHAFKT